MTSDLNLTFYSWIELANLIESHAQATKPRFWPTGQVAIDAPEYCACGWFGDSWAGHLTDVLVWASTADEDDEDYGLWEDHERPSLDIPWDEA